MEITSLQELAHCREQILLLRNHQVLLCQAGEHWGKNSTIFYKKIHNFKEKMFMWLKCINPCCVTFSMWHYPLHTHFGSYFLEQNPKWICLFYNLYYNILCISYMCKWALFIFYLLIPFFFKKPTNLTSSFQMKWPKDSGWCFSHVFTVFILQYFE